MELSANNFEEEDPSKRELISDHDYDNSTDRVSDPASTQTPAGTPSPVESNADSLFKKSSVVFHRRKVLSTGDELQGILEMSFKISGMRYSTLPTPPVFYPVGPPHVSQAIHVLPSLLAHVHLAHPLLTLPQPAQQPYCAYLAASYVLPRAPPPPAPTLIFYPSAPATRIADPRIARFCINPLPLPMLDLGFALCLHAWNPSLVLPLHYRAASIVASYRGHLRSAKARPRSGKITDRDVSYTDTEVWVDARRVSGSSYSCCADKLHSV
ncbi:uncharacterized protein LOC133907147 [Phragmites australis]|uniref:uncharacterized protein LOC133907147 n=1 Tax=Phragmites australis TaxID=29695 RepID=UPI002D77B1F2|nr:uncharacterized protein LOC133907147 [Phragmites australis]